MVVGKMEMAKGTTGSVVSSSPETFCVCSTSLNEHPASLEHTVDKMLLNFFKVISFYDEACRLFLFRLQACFGLINPISC